MRLRVLELEGREDELAPYANRFFAQNGQAPSPTEGQESGLPAELSEYLDNTVGRTGARRNLVEAIFRRVLAFGPDVDARFGPHGRNGQPRYVRLHRRGSGKGAFMYLGPNRMDTTFRLPADAADGREQAFARQVQSANVYQVKCSIRSEAAVDEVLELARMAYDAVSPA